MSIKTKIVVVESTSSCKNASLPQWKTTGYYQCSRQLHKMRYDADWICCAKTLSLLQYSYRFPPLGCSPLIRVLEFGIRTNTGAGGTVWQLNLYIIATRPATAQREYVFYHNLTPDALEVIMATAASHILHCLWVTPSYSTWIFCRGVSGFATDCPCGVWCRGLTTCLLHVGPPYGNRILNNSWAVGLT